MKTVRAPADQSATGNLHQIGKYRLVATLGQGGMGTVYLALASGLGEFRKLLVVKELRQDLTRQEGFVHMFMDEAKLAARLDHPNVVQTFEAGQESDRYFLAMEYLDGQPLSALIDRLAAAKALPLWVHIQILCEVLSGLHYAHQLADYDGTRLHVVHRDVSPQNVFVTYHGQVKVVDFGVAKAAGASTMTEPGVFKGKFAYAAPEQVLGRPIDERTDIFAVGVMLWQAIAGERFSEQIATPASFRVRAAGKEPRIKEVVPDVDPQLAEICDRALAVNPEDRFRSANEFRSELQEYLALSGVRVEAPEIGEFMRDVFESERRSIHLLIEQAMKNGGASDSSVEALPFLHRGDSTDQTAVADLSRLVDVSSERDDDKIRRGYAHSKVSVVRKKLLAQPDKAQRPAAQSWLVAASLGLSAVCLVAVSTVLFSRRDPTQVPAAAAASLPPPSATPPAAPTIMLVETREHAAPTSPAPKEIEPSAQPELAQEPDPLPETTSTGKRPVATPARRIARTDTGRASGAAHEAGQLVVAEPASARPSADAKSEPSQGMDLRQVRRGADPRIDVEDPYR